MQWGNLPVPDHLRGNCILSPCLWLYLLEQALYLKIWTTVQNIRRCFHIEFWEYFLVGLLADIMAIVPDGMYYAPGGGGTLGISGWGCAAGSLEPLTFTRAISAEFCYPILE